MYSNNKKFNNVQKNEIRKGIEDGIDTSVYAKPEFDVTQMQEIRLGLKNGLDVSIYANSDLIIYKCFK